MDPRPGENHLTPGMVSMLDYAATGKGVKAKLARVFWEDARHGQAKLVCLIDAQTISRRDHGHITQLAREAQSAVFRCS